VSELGTLVLDLAGRASTPVVLAFGPTAGDLFFQLGRAPSS
jgi:hypothetical protein